MRKVKQTFYTCKDVADILDVSIRTVRRIIASGELKGRKVGCQWRFTEMDILNYMDSNTSEQPSTEPKKLDIKNCDLCGRKTTVLYSLKYVEPVAFMDFNFKCCRYCIKKVNNLVVSILDGGIKNGETRSC